MTFYLKGIKKVIIIDEICKHYATIIKKTIDLKYLLSFE